MPENVFFFLFRYDYDNGDVIFYMSIHSLDILLNTLKIKTSSQASCLLSLIREILNKYLNC